MKYAAWAMIFAVGMLAGSILTIADHGLYETLEDKQREFDAHRTCLQMAGRIDCHLGVDEILRYLELRDELEGADEGTHTP